MRDEWKRHHESPRSGVGSERTKLYEVLSEKAPRCAVGSHRRHKEMGAALWTAVKVGLKKDPAYCRKMKFSGLVRSLLGSLAAIFGIALLVAFFQLEGKLVPAPNNPSILDVVRNSVRSTTVGKLFLLPPLVAVMGGIILFVLGLKQYAKMKIILREIQRGE
jgi:hypothetical protein